MLEVHSDGPNHVVLLDGHVLRGVTSVNVTQAVGDAARVTLELVVGKIETTGVGPVTSTNTTSKVEDEDQAAIVRELTERGEWPPKDSCECPGRKYGGHREGCPRREATPFA